MIYASVPGGSAPAWPMGGATCPTCDAPVLAKCGTHVVCNWAHEAHTSCDPWKENETDWHRLWKSRFPAELVEVSQGEHRADVLLPDGTAVEFQSQGLSTDELCAREAHWGRVVWVVRAPGLNQWRDEGAPLFEVRRRDTHCTFRWRHARRSWGAARGRVILDLTHVAQDESPTGFMFELKRVHWAAPTGGWGHPMKRNELVEQLTSAARSGGRIRW